MEKRNPVDEKLKTQNIEASVANESEIKFVSETKHEQRSLVNKHLLVVKDKENMQICK